MGLEPLARACTLSRSNLLLIKSRSAMVSSLPVSTGRTENTLNLLGTDQLTGSRSASIKTPPVELISTGISKPAQVRLLLHAEQDQRHRGPARSCFEGPCS